MSLNLSTYLVADPDLCGPRGVRDTVLAAVSGGVTAVQLRDKDAPADSLHRLAAELLRALDGTGVPLLVNDRLDVALAAGAHGVHLGQDDVDVEEARSLAGPQLLIGLSVSTPDEMSAANALADGTVDYLGVGPVFATPTKTDAKEPLGIDGLADLCRRTTLPCVAIGGIHAGNADAVRGAGVDGVAVISAICTAPDPAEAAVALGGSSR
ncbi:MAG: thiamine phosphate synthase [Actinomycetota bacterium]|nr:thiamine phosphate synthase [Actinomycetota bacterium]